MSDTTASLGVHIEPLLKGTRGVGGSLGFLHTRFK